MLNKLSDEALADGFERRHQQQQRYFGDDLKRRQFLLEMKTRQHAFEIQGG